MIAELTQDHDRLRSIANELDRYLDSAFAPVDIHFSRLRWALIGQLTTHLARERAAFGAAGCAHDHGCLDDALDTALREHMLRWDVRAIQQRWSHYRQALRALLLSLRHRMHREEAHLFPRYIASASNAALHPA